MNTQSNIIIGTQFEEDILVGRINVNGVLQGIILPPKLERQYPEAIKWNKEGIKGALSYCDGQANTRDMAEAGSELAKWALEKGMHIPSQDEMEIIYRACKPTKDTNYLYNRSGVNVSAVPPTYPYTKESPEQTGLEQFRAGGPEAFDTNDWYWTSTRHADNATTPGCRPSRTAARATTTWTTSVLPVRSAGLTFNSSI